MEVRNISSMEALHEHSGPVSSWIMFEEKRDNLGGGIQFVNEFEVKAGDTMEPHVHNFEEFYYVLYGRGEMDIDGEKKEVIPGDLIRIPPNLVHSINTLGKDTPIHSFCFAVSVD